MGLRTCMSLLSELGGAIEIATKSGKGTRATMLVPVGIAYAQASGIPGIYGLYATIIPLLAYALFGPSRILVLGPAEAPMALIRGRYRFRLLVHGEKRSDMQAYLRAWLSAAPRERGSVRLQVDVDPQSFL